MQILMIKMKIDQMSFKITQKFFKITQKFFELFQTDCLKIVDSVMKLIQTNIIK